MEETSGLYQIELAAKSVGVSVVYTNSDDRIEAQLNRATKDSNIPIMLISWDIDTNIEFDKNGFLKNPSSNIVALLVSKPIDLKINSSIYMAEDMGKLFLKFIRILYVNLNQFQKSSAAPISSASYKLAPKHGAGQHSGVLAKWTQRNYVEMDCDV